MRRENGFHCRRCRRQTLHAREVFPAVVGILLTLLTAGAFIPLWLVLAVIASFSRPWRCQQCGEPRAPLTAWLIMGSITALMIAAVWLGYSGYIPPPKEWGDIGAGNGPLADAVTQEAGAQPVITHQLQGGLRGGEGSPPRPPVWANKRDALAYLNGSISARPFILRNQARRGDVEFVEPSSGIIILDGDDQALASETPSLDYESRLFKVQHVRGDWEEEEADNWAGWVLGEHIRVRHVPAEELVRDRENRSR